ncbi:helix-turn-helix domain-containing protein [Paenibacillus lutimineralis]|uniref:Helix-turn-helix domain-containing protein n=1 Tax=Paenibacillus lutimineralis TaxID=2707005 RepID=A0A3Q9I706_9BACL|nr:helix-turn-helix domain-containing protein [Paenibacillus lutimineralis]
MSVTRAESQRINANGQKCPSDQVTIILSPNYLSSLFKKKAGISLSDYIQRERIHEAMKLLTLTQYSISDICDPQAVQKCGTTI